MKRLFFVTCLLSVYICSSYAEKEHAFDFSINNRLRYDARECFAPGHTDEMADLANRLIIEGIYSYKDNLNIFLFGHDAREWTDGTAGRGYDESLDLNQAFVRIYDLSFLLPDIKLGRQSVSLGKKRIIAAPSWGNKIRTFDAARLDFQTSLLHSTLFVGHLVKFEDEHFNRSSNNEQLSGLYNVITPYKAMCIDVYLFNLRKKGIDAEGLEVTDDRYSAGARFNHKASGTETDFELIYQYGEDKTGDDVDAYAVAFFVKQSFDHSLDPWVKFEANFATGDSNPDDNKNETFMVPYQTMHAPYGIIDYFKLQNMRELALISSFNPTKELRVQSELHWYWLENTNDDWYKNSGRTFVESGVIDDSYAGAEASLIASCDAADGISIEGGYSVFFPGDAAEAITDNPVHYGYLQTKLKY